MNWYDGYFCGERGRCERIEAMMMLNSEKHSRFFSLRLVNLFHSAGMNMSFLSSCLGKSGWTIRRCRQLGGEHPAAEHFALIPSLAALKGTIHRKVQEAA